ncbi:MAG: DUF4149 domain-containing protein [Phycisphaerae bacterium]
MILNVVRAVAAAAAAVWLGTLLIMGAVVAPTTFGMMRESGIANPNTVAGHIMAKNFAKADRIELACAAVVVAWQIVSMLIGPRARRDWFRLILIVVAAALVLYLATLTPKIADFQPALSSARPDVEVRAAFQQFHKAAVRVAQVELFLVLVLVMEMALPTRRATTSPSTAKPGP